MKIELPHELVQILFDSQDDLPGFGDSYVLESLPGLIYIIDYALAETRLHLAEHELLNHYFLLLFDFEGGVLLERGVKFGHFLYLFLLL